MRNKIYIVGDIVDSYGLLSIIMSFVIVIITVFVCHRFLKMIRVWYQTWINEHINIDNDDDFENISGEFDPELEARISDAKLDIEIHNKMVKRFNDLQRQSRYPDPELMLNVQSHQYDYKKLQIMENIRRVGDNEYRNFVSKGIVEQASHKRLKYFCKYFYVEYTAETIAKLQSMYDAMAKMKKMMNRIFEHESMILGDIFEDRKWNAKEQRRISTSLGMLSPIVEYTKCILLSTNANGKVYNYLIYEFDEELTLELLEYVALQSKHNIKVKKERGAITSNLRSKIKERDNYTCQYCGSNIYDEPSLLLEIDHIIPVSKGGVSDESNLQVLCWRCNRSKGNK